MVALCAASVVYAGSFKTWDAAKIFEEFLPNFQIHTGLGNGLETEGYWYSYNDNNNLGTSKIAWPAQIDAYDNINQSLDPVIMECKGLAGTAILSKESYEHDPYVGVGFNVVGETSETNPAPDIGDASAWGGLCVTYMSDTDIALELGLGETVDSTINYANPAITLPAAKAPNILSPNGKYGNKVVVNWSDFKQPSWYDGAVKINGETAAKQLAAIHFKIQADPGSYNFNICAIGPKDGTCPEKCGKSTSAGQFITWNGADENVTSQVETGLRNETDISGYWVAYSDDSDGAESKILWDIDLSPEWIPNKYDPIIDYCKGMCGTAHLRKATSSHVPSANVAFCVVGTISEHDFSLVTGDASSWGGLCVTYTSDTNISLELDIDDTDDPIIDNASPAVKLPTSKTGNRMIFSWSDFKQPSSYDGSIKIDGEAAAKQLTAVKFKIQAEDGDYRFNICAVGPKDGTCPEQCGTPSAGIQIARGTSAVKAILNGRTLGFTGIKSTATVEVLNSLGQVVMKGAINNAATLNLTSLNAGIYMVRVNGKNVNFAKKIVLR
ncbi:hypothetical protein FSU_3189 [Fibrobacter succinogenes subsp. succinogenes S85]|uniref:Secretion system C-terminal sorting domain-containing protein n=1 Tax=Fibrobacter succinogenes (strain ATCC 19169 / S85) TaxID=59374 RepID=D9S8H7_FIBSS|nr:hypothetical protein FSU_3189 [Fibrobacter succinogenes subsp. succinogenes S85]